jgi:hypothetical protein
MLMCIVSLIPRGAIDMTVHNQYSDIELVSPVYFCNRGTYDARSVKGKNASTMMNINFSFGLDGLPGGILVYEVRRERNTKSDCQSSTNTTSAETVGDTSRIMQILVAWNVKRFGEPRVHIVLVEHDSMLILNGDKLAKLYDKVNDQLAGRSDFSKSAWMVCDNTVLKATYEIAQEEGLTLKITISKGAKNEYAKSALWIDPERQVSFSGNNTFYANLHC